MEQDISTQGRVEVKEGGRMPPVTPKAVPALPIPQFKCMSHLCASALSPSPLPAFFAFFLFINLFKLRFFHSHEKILSKYLLPKPPLTHPIFTVLPTYEQ